MLYEYITAATTTTTTTTTSSSSSSRRTFLAREIILFSYSLHYINRSNSRDSPEDTNTNSNPQSTHPPTHTSHPAQASQHNTMFRQASRTFSTNARMPSIYFMQTPRRIVMRWIPPTVAVVAVGYGLNVYREGMVQRRLARTAAAEKQAIEDRKRATMLMDAYGDRSSLEALEKAMEVYESQNQT
ncbi:hypothetical protein CTA1_11194 [Colletotrichum tanaceti]|uniref:Uncharacterized protein n=1 Tax=Colletotrichum tanaceti TaxID=1306861 RepID=A0A4U6X562_9PEZI|nr:hypothetical protein CTA1_11194 [Colletotrichum tanaceti]